MRRNGGSLGSSGDEAEPRIPNSCVYVDRDIFEVTYTRGKSLASGGFGFVKVGRLGASSTPARGPSPSPTDDTIAREPCQKDQKRTKYSPPTAAVTEYLLLEEVLFLHERGLLECRTRRQTAIKSRPSDRLREVDEHGDSAKSLCNASPSLSWNSFQLYSLLNQGDSVSLPVYLVYAHLRKQGFRVIRHTAHRRPIIESQCCADRDGSRTNQRIEGADQSTKVRLALRNDAASAAAPSLFSLAWDVYEPNSQFKRSSPGLPDFYAAVALYNTPMKVDRILELVAECDGIPFQIGTVSDSGQVVMLGVHDFAAPSIISPSVSSP
jgi:hypothetical protein